MPFQHSWSQAWVKEERSQRQKGEGCNRLGKLRWKPNHSYEPRENRWGIKENGVVFATVHWNYRSFSLHGDSCWVVSSYPNSTGVGTCFWKIWKMIRPHLTDIQQQNLTHVICLSFFVWHGSSVFRLLNFLSYYERRFLIRTLVAKSKGISEKEMDILIKVYINAKKSM